MEEVGTWYRRLWDRRGPSGARYRALSGLLLPAEWAYRLGVWARTSAFDREWLTSEACAITTLAIGNLTVGGTGKTPIAAWFARAFRERGCRSAIVMRGYGADEVEVHRCLNRAIPVYATPDRIAGVRRAKDGGSDVAILDDAFQYRLIRADAHVVLVAAEDWTDTPRLLPRGPWREPLTALRRATLVVVTRKKSPRRESERVAASLAELEPGLPQAQAHIKLGGLALYDQTTGEVGPIRPARGLHCELAVAGVARPEAVFAQLRQAGVTMNGVLAFRDHHRYKDDEISQLAERARHGPIVATLKDAVKLGPALGPGAKLYVPVQVVDWESGSDGVECLLDNLLCRAASGSGEQL